MHHEEGCHQRGLRGTPIQNLYKHGFHFIPIIMKLCLFSQHELRHHESLVALSPPIHLRFQSNRTKQWNCYKHNASDLVRDILQASLQITLFELNNNRRNLVFLHKRRSTRVPKDLNNLVINNNFSQNETELTLNE